MEDCLDGFIEMKSTRKLFDLSFLLTETHNCNQLQYHRGRAAGSIY